MPRPEYDSFSTSELRNTLAVATMVVDGLKAELSFPSDQSSNLKKVHLRWVPVARSSKLKWHNTPDEIPVVIVDLRKDTSEELFITAEVQSRLKDDLFNEYRIGYDHFFTTAVDGISNTHPYIETSHDHGFYDEVPDPLVEIRSKSEDSNLNIFSPPDEKGMMNILGYVVTDTDSDGVSVREMVFRVPTLYPNAFDNTGHLYDIDEIDIVYREKKTAEMIVGLRLNFDELKKRINPDILDYWIKCFKWDFSREVSGAKYFLNYLWELFSRFPGEDRKKFGTIGLEGIDVCITRHDRGQETVIEGGKVLTKQIPENIEIEMFPVLLPVNKGIKQSLTQIAIARKSTTPSGKLSIKIELAGEKGIAVSAQVFRRNDFREYPEIDGNIDASYFTNSDILPLVLFAITASDPNQINQQTYGNIVYNSDKDRLKNPWAKEDNDKGRGRKPHIDQRSHTHRHYKRGR